MWQLNEKSNVDKPHMWVKNENRKHLSILYQIKYDELELLHMLVRWMLNHSFQTPYKPT